jgi:hypothetical protein
MRYYLKQLISGVASADHATGSALDINASTETVSLDVNKQPDEVRIIVQNQTGAFSVDVNFDNTSRSVQSATDSAVDTQEPVASDTTVEVVISDDSGASNTVDYDILLV